MKRYLVTILLFITLIINVSAIKADVYPSQDLQVNKDTSIYIKFSENMNPEYINRFTFVLNDGSADIKGKVIYNNDEKTAYFVPNNYLKPGNNYKCILYKGVQSEKGDVLEKDIVWSFRVIDDNVVVSTLADLSLDIKDKLMKKKEFIEVLTTEPEHNKIIDKTGPVIIKFSSPIDKESVNMYTFMVKTSTKKIEGNLEVIDNKVTFFPFKPYDLDTGYTVTLTNFIKDINGRSLRQNYEFVFRMAKEKAHDTPIVTENFPGSNDFNVSPNASIIVRFNNKMDPASLNRFNVVLFNGTKNVWGNIQYNEKTKTLTFDPEEDLPINTKCTFKLRRTVRDLENQYLASDYELIFSTGSENIILLNEKDRKLTDATVDKDKTDLKAENAVFTERYKLKSDYTFFLKEYNPKDRETLISVDSKVKIEFSHAADPLTVNQFTITVSDGVKNIWGDVIYQDEKFSAYFAPKEPLRHNTMYYVKISDDIKNIKGNNLDRFYEWTFITEPLPDKTPAQILEVYPGDKEIKVKDDIIVRVKFNEEIRPESLNKFTVMLTDGSNKLPCDITYDKEKNIAFIAPIDRLLHSHQYKMILGQAISDIAGNFMSKETSWTFWVGTPPDKTPPGILAISPRENAPVYTKNPKISITFNEEMDTKTLTPFNFGVLKDGTPVKGIVRYSSITNTAIYDYMEKLEFGQIYTVFIRKNLKDANGNAYPKDIAWDFIVSHKDKTLPLVTASFPHNEKLNFSTTSPLYIQFNKDMNPISFNKFTVKLRDIRDEYIKGEIVYDSNKRELTFKPFIKLAHNTKYILSINKFIQDTEGKNMEKEYNLIFYTEGRGHNEEED